MDKQAGRQADQQTGRRTHRQADRQAGRQADRQSDGQTGRHQRGRQTERQANRQAGRQKDRQTDRKTGRQTERSGSCSGSPPKVNCFFLTAYLSHTQNFMRIRSVFFFSKAAHRQTDRQTHRKTYMDENITSPCWKIAEITRLVLVSLRSVNSVKCCLREHSLGLKNNVIHTNHCHCIKDEVIKG